MTHSLNDNVKKPALLEEPEPAVNINESIVMTAPGIVAYQSALKNGLQLEVPDLSA